SLESSLQSSTPSVNQARNGPFQQVEDTVASVAVILEGWIVLIRKAPQDLRSRKRARMRYSFVSLRVATVATRCETNGR
ncbi:hypothetical protein, partial [Marivita sp. S2033]|uniref:hypothetical protein n=1 Tax=Marivita sp. S2033 TaxID=3373187 RepID=UPI0039825B75